MRLSENPSCQHHHVNNDTARCEACNEIMEAMTWESESVLSAPNAWPCTDPDHLEAIRLDHDFECHHPYVPDEARARNVIIGYTVSYRCKRCDQHGTVIDSHGVTWDCGHSHRGKTLAPDAKVIRHAIEEDPDTNKSAEQRARDLLEDLGMPDAQAMSAGDLVELANYIADAAAYRKAKRS